MKFSMDGRQVRESEVYEVWGYECQCVRRLESRSSFMYLSCVYSEEKHEAGGCRA